MVTQRHSRKQNSQRDCLVDTERESEGKPYDDKPNGQKVNNDSHEKLDKDEGKLQAIKKFINK